MIRCQSNYLEPHLSLRFGAGHPDAGDAGRRILASALMRCVLA
jgi:hypothetical protein